MLGNVLVALGNRAWGAGEVKNWIGVLLMSLGVFISSGTPAWTILAFFVTLYIFRSHSARPWLSMREAPNYFKSVLRSCLILPHAILMLCLLDSFTPLVVSLAVIFLIPLAYYISYRLFLTKDQLKLDITKDSPEFKALDKGTTLAELATGLLISLI